MENGSNGGRDRTNKSVKIMMIFSGSCPMILCWKNTFIEEMNTNKRLESMVEDIELNKIKNTQLLLVDVEIFHDGWNCYQIYLCAERIGTNMRLSLTVKSVK